MPSTNLYTPSLAEPVEDTIVISGCKREVLKIEVSGEEYELCEKAAQNMWSSGKPGFFGGGMVNTKDDDKRVERTGRLGEMAFAKTFGVPVDLSYREHGDDRDFTLLTNIRADIKTGTKRPRYNAGLVKATNDRGSREKPLDCDVYFFGFVEDEDREAKRATVVLVGGSTKPKVKTREKVPARLGDHLNYEIPYEKMAQMPEVLKLYRRVLASRAAVGRA